MRYLEQRIEDLEQLVQELKVKLFRKEWKESPKPWEKAASDYLYNPSLTILPEPELETAFASPWEVSEFEKNLLDTITVKQPDHLDSNYPAYLNILGSWDDQEKNPLDVLEDSPTSANFKKAYEEVTKARKAYDKELSNHFSFSESSQCILNSKKCNKKA